MSQDFIESTVFTLIKKFVLKFRTKNKQERKIGDEVHEKTKVGVDYCSQDGKIDR